MRREVMSEETWTGDETTLLHMGGRVWRTANLDNESDVKFTLEAAEDQVRYCRLTKEEVSVALTTDKQPTLLWGTSWYDDHVYFKPVALPCLSVPVAFDALARLIRAHGKVLIARANWPGEVTWYNDDFNNQFIMDTPGGTLARNFRYVLLRPIADQESQVRRHVWNEMEQALKQRLVALDPLYSYIHQSYWQQVIAFLSRIPKADWKNLPEVKAAIALNKTQTTHWTDCQHLIELRSMNRKDCVDHVRKLMAPANDKQR